MAAEWVPWCQPATELVIAEEDRSIQTGDVSRRRKNSALSRCFFSAGTPTGESQRTWRDIEREESLAGQRPVWLVSR